MNRRCPNAAGSYPRAHSSRRTNATSAPAIGSTPNVAAMTTTPNITSRLIHTPSSATSWCWVSRRNGFGDHHTVVRAQARESASARTTLASACAMRRLDLRLGPPPPDGSLGRATALDGREVCRPHEQPRRDVEGVRQREQDAHAEVRRSALDALQIAEVLTRALGESLLGQPSPQARPSDVRGDGLKELGQGTVGHTTARTRGDAS